MPSRARHAAPRARRPPRACRAACACRRSSSVRSLVRSTLGVDAAAIRSERLRVVRGGTVVLPDLSCEVESGSVTGLLGPSGSGKTTFMRAIVGVQRLAAGRVEVLGEPAGAKTLRSRVGYMTQAPSVYGDLSVRENLRFFARVLGAPSESVDRAVDEVSLADF